MQNVLDSVIGALLEDENRKFIYVETVTIHEPFRFSLVPQILTLHV